MIDGLGIVDPDRFFWAHFPVGDPPPIRRSTRAVWQDAGERMGSTAHRG